MLTRSDLEVGWERARLLGITSDREYEAYRGTLDYQQAIFRERAGDLAWLMLGPLLRPLGIRNRRDRA